MTDSHRLPPSSRPRYEAPQPHRYTMADLSRESGVSARTIRYYISEGLLQPAYGRGPTAVYDADHLLRLKYIQKLKDDRLPLQEIRDKLNQLAPDDLAVAMKIQVEPLAEAWRRFRLHQDFEILVRERQVGDRPAAHDHAFDLIVEYARTVLEELDRRPDE